MIYVEEILDEITEIKITRQKDSLKSEWYGITLYSYIYPNYVCLSDNDKFILPLAYNTKSEIINAFKFLAENVPTKVLAKGICKVVKEAEALGWFNE